MDELLRALGLTPDNFASHDLKVGDRVRMVDVGRHKFEYAAELMPNGEEGTVVHTGVFAGLMPLFEVKPDGGRTITTEDGVIDRVPFANTSIGTVIKIEGGTQ